MVFEFTIPQIIDIGISIVILVVAFVLGKYICSAIIRGAKKLTEKTKTTLDDRVFSAIRGLLFWLIIAIALYFAVFRLAAVAPYSQLLGQAFSVLWVIFAILFTLRVGNAILNWYSEEIAPERLEKIAPMARRVWTALIVVIGLIMILGAFGIEISPLLASLGIAGLAVALALQETLSNFFSGVYLTAERPIRIGDYIQLETGDEGYVTDIGWRSTRIKTLPGNTTIIPNSRLANTIIKNYYMPEKEMAVLVQVSVSYDSDLKKVEKITVDTAKKILKKIEGAVPEFEPFIRYHTFADSGIEFTVILRCNEFVSKYLLKHEFIKSLHEAYKKHDIEIPYPKSDVYIKGIKR